LNLKDVKILLDKEVENRNTLTELSLEKPDPLLIASQYKDESIALICALFAYGNAGQIVKFLSSLDFSLLDENEEVIEKALSSHYYRFQKSEDVSALFIALKRLKEEESIENLFYEGYKKEHNILDGLWHFIETLQDLYPHHTRGYRFLVGTLPKKISSAGTYKRYMMYLRWMVRKDELDMGLWSKIDKKVDLLIQLKSIHNYYRDYKHNSPNEEDLFVADKAEAERIAKEINVTDPNLIILFGAVKHTLLETTQNELVFMFVIFLLDKFVGVKPYALSIMDYDDIAFQILSAIDPEDLELFSFTIFSGLKALIENEEFDESQLPPLKSGSL